MVQSAGRGTWGWTKEVSSKAVREAVALDGSIGRCCGRRKLVKDIQ